MTFQHGIQREKSSRLPAPSYTFWKSWGLSLQPQRQVGLRSSGSVCHSGSNSNCCNRLTSSQSRLRSLLVALIRLPRPMSRASLSVLGLQPVRSVQRLGSSLLCCGFGCALLQRSERASAAGHCSPRPARASWLARHTPLFCRSFSCDASVCVQGTVFVLSCVFLIRSVSRTCRPEFTPRMSHPITLTV